MRTARPSYGIFRLLPWYAAFFSCFPLLLNGFPAGHDVVNALARVAEFLAALQSGQIIPHWANNLYGGYGSPVFLFYAPLFSATASGFAWLSGSVSSGATAAVILFSLLATQTSKKLLATAAGDGEDDRHAAAARIAAYLFVLNPYLVGDRLLRCADAEFAALALMPLALAGLVGIRGNNDRRSMLMLAMGLGLVIVAHNLSALVVTAVVVVAAPFLHWQRRGPKVWGALLGGIVLGLGLGCFFWAPALALQSLVRIDTMTIGEYDFHNRFPPLASLFGYREYYSTGMLVPMGLAMAAWVAWVSRGKHFSQRRLLIAALIGAAVAVFLQTRASILIWEAVPYLPLFQFPWRMMGILALLAAISSSLAFLYFFGSASTRVRNGMEAAVFFLCLANAFPFLCRYEALPGDIDHLFLPETLRNSNLSATIIDEFLPRAAVVAADPGERNRAGPLVQASVPVQLTVERDLGSRLDLVVLAPDRSLLRFGRWAFPGWQATVNGQRVALQPDRNGLVSLWVPQGENRLSLRLEPPRVRRVALAVSCVSLLVWVGLAVIGGMVGRGHRPGAAR